MCMPRRSYDQRLAALKTFVTNTHSMAGLDPAIQDYLSSVDLWLWMTASAGGHDVVEGEA